MRTRLLQHFLRFSSSRPHLTGRASKSKTDLWNVLSTTKALERMFTHGANKLNMFAAMNNGSLILINTAKEYLHQEACQIFGKFMIALITQATLERGAATG